MKINNEMTAQQHFLELKKRIIFSALFFILSFVLCYFFSQELYKFLLKPLIEISQNNSSRKLIYTSPTEAFMTYLKTSFYCALFFSTPILLTQIYLFLSPALYKNEKKNILFLFFFSPFLFLFGSIFCYNFILPLALKFFVSFENQGLVNNENFSIFLETKVSEYLSFVINLLFGFGIAFQLPLFLLFLIKFDFLSVRDLQKKRRYWIIAIFILAAILTPPDIVSQISLAILLIFLFEIVILLSKNINKK
jgi:sec-independent protein translocase protein TatC